MGFRELGKFNDSLLTKQIWRLKNNEESLFHKVFKAKFFPDCSILDCEAYNKGLYAWKSLLQAKHVVKLGVVGGWEMVRLLRSGGINGFLRS